MTFNRISVLIAPVVILALFGPTLIGLDRLAFRDVGHFYLPLYDYVAHRTSDQWLPLWNPLDQTGIPLLGETTTAVLYPVRYLLFALPISTSLALAWYVAAHLILASFTARWAALQSGASSATATIAGVIYPLSGSVLFLYTNPPFLVGASWLPLVLGAVMTRETLSAKKRCLIAGPAMAMMILGGDPQTALHAMLVSLAIVFAGVFKSDNKRPLRASIIALCCVPLLAAVLTAPQLAASLSWSSQSGRVQSTDQRSWREPPAPGSQRSDAFQFSLPPWHTLELLSANAFGELFPENRRISSLIAGDGRMWTPSIYLGLLTAIAIISQLARRQFDVWLVIGAAALLLSFGHFGLVWLLQQIPGVLPGVDSAIAGPYWWLYQCLPGYDSFRYPVKWLPILSLAAAIVTARWIESPDWRAIRKIAIAMSVCLSLSLIAISIFRWQFQSTASLVDSYWGPLDVAAGLGQVQWSIVHSLIGLTALVTTLFYWIRTPGPGLLVLLIALVGVEMGWSHRGLIARVSRAEEQTQLKQQSQPIPTAKRWMRTQSRGGWPLAWQTAGDVDRMLDVAVGERLAWFGRWHLAKRQAVINNMVSIQSHDTALFWNACRLVTRRLSRTEQTRFWESVRTWLAVDGVLAVDGASSSTRGEDIAKAVNVKYQTDPSGVDRFQFSDQWSVAKDIDAKAFARFLQSVFENDGRSIPIVQADGVKASTEAIETKRSHQIRSISDRELTIVTETAGLLTRPIFQDGHWVAEFRAGQTKRWQPLAVHKVSLLQQGVMLSAGHWHVRFHYRPKWLAWTIVLSVIGWLGVGLAVASCWIRSSATPSRSVALNGRTVS